MSQTQIPALQEARARTAMSRAYFAAYNRTWQYLRSIGQTKYKQDHVTVINLCKLDRRLKQVGENLARLKKYRNEADYEVNMRPNPIREAPLAVGLARMVFAELAALTPQSHPPG